MCVCVCACVIKLSIIKRMESELYAMLGYKHFIVVPVITWYFFWLLVKKVQGNHKTTYDLETSLF